MNRWYIIAAVVISAVITFSLRALPFVVFSGERKMPEFLDKLGKMLPSAVMATLIIYCLKDINGSFFNKGLFQLISVIVVYISYKWKHNTFISILLGTLCYMVLLRLPI